MKTGEKLLLVAVAVLLLTLYNCVGMKNKEAYVWGGEAAQAVQAEVDILDEDTLRLHRNTAQWYNLNLQTDVPEPGFENSYESILSFSGQVMGVLEIPEIGVYTAIYHGTGEFALENGVGHLASTAFPIGGMGNHTVLVGQGRRALDYLDALSSGDRFYIHILGETLTYEVQEFPLDGSYSGVPDQDLCSLVSCKPEVTIRRCGVRVMEEDAALALNS